MTARLLVMLAMLVVLADSLPAQVSFERILNAVKEPHNWLTYSGTYTGQRYSTLAQITPANAGELELKWVFQARWLDYYQATPLVVDGIMYTTQGNDVLALDAATGKMFWIYRYTPAADAKFCCGRITRGLAILGDTLFLATVDAHLIAIDARSGRPVWHKVVAQATAGYSMTLAPLVIKDKVIVGTAGGEFGIRGFLAAYDAKTGKEAWRFNTVPLPGEPGHETWGEGWKHGGASIWLTGSYDPETNLTFWGVGNPGPDYNAETRPGDNLYSNSVVALDADTGKLKWHYQFSPADEFDWDAVQMPVLADISWKGSQRKAMLWANRNGFFYVLDRTTGEFLQAHASRQTELERRLRREGPAHSRAERHAEPGRRAHLPWQSGGDELVQSVVQPAHRTVLRQRVGKHPPHFRPHRPGVQGRRDVYSGSADHELSGARDPAGMRAAQRPNLRMEEENYGTVRAFDPQTGKWKWEYKMSDLTDAGILTTASDILFTGGREGYFFALDARSGSLLWKIQLGGPIQNGPMTLSVNGRQYVAVSASNSLFVFGLR